MREMDWERRDFGGVRGSVEGRGERWGEAG